MDTHIFSEHAPKLRDMGLAVIPCGGEDGKRPLVHSFDKWKSRPSQKAISKFSEQDPSANIGILMGLSNLTVIDVDNASEVETAIDQFGDTPFKVRTARGAHLYYRKSSKLNSSMNLRSSGLNIDIKAGNSSFVIAPPSLHYKSGSHYELDDCDLSDLRDIPPIKGIDLFLKHQEAKKPTEVREANNVLLRGPVHEGQRRQALNDRLVRNCGSCPTLDDLLNLAHVTNESDIKPTLTDTDVVDIAQRVWADKQSGKIVATKKGNGYVSESREEFVDFNLRGGNSDAYFLLQNLRFDHTARVLRGESFALVTKKMALAGYIPSWGDSKYRAAVKNLLDSGYLRKVRSSWTDECGKRYPAQYTLTNV